MVVCSVRVQLPPSFRPRLHAQEQLLSALLARDGSRSTAVTAPKSRISSQGMGGVGKTMLTAAGTASAVVVCDLTRSIALFLHAVVRDERLRAGFKVGRYTAQHVRSTELIHVLV